MYFYQLDFKRQVFPGKRVVGIYGDRIVRDTGDGDYTGSTILRSHPQPLTNLWNQVDVVRTGQEALDYLYNQDAFADKKKYPRPGLILLDLSLPGIDGRAFAFRPQLSGRFSSESPPPPRHPPQAGRTSLIRAGR